MLAARRAHQCGLAASKLQNASEKRYYHAILFKFLGQCEAHIASQGINCCRSAAKLNAPAQHTTALGAYASCWEQPAKGTYLREQPAKGTYLRAQCARCILEHRPGASLPALSMQTPAFCLHGQRCAWGAGACPEKAQASSTSKPPPKHTNTQEYTCTGQK
jgi:hypothetical protein